MTASNLSINRNPASEDNVTPTEARMNTTLKLNLALGWIWIVLGFGSGFLLGLGFHKENWLGGYASHTRRMLRLGHISFFGLAAVNLLFYFSTKSLAAAGSSVQWASWLFVIGAVSMPICCALMAWSAKCRLLFSVPVLSLLAAGLLTVLEVIKL